MLYEVALPFIHLEIVRLRFKLFCSFPCPFFSLAVIADTASSWAESTISPCTLGSSVLICRHKEQEESERPRIEFTSSIHALSEHSLSWYWFPGSLIIKLAHYLLGMEKVSDMPVSPRTRFLVPELPVFFHFQLIVAQAFVECVSRPCVPGGVLCWKEMPHEVF